MGSRQPSSYRPISLANVIYKLYSALLQTRLAKHFDWRISEFQCGFRKNVPLPTPSFSFAVWLNCLRGTPPHFTFLLSQAFDCMSHAHLTASLVRIGLPLPIGACYLCAVLKWQVLCNSLFLFLFKLFPLARYPSRLPLEPVSLHSCSVCAYARRPYHFCIPPLYFHAISTHTPLSDIEYADDTILIARTQLTLHRLLRTLQHEACKRGLLLNPEECKLLQIHTSLQIHLLPEVDPCPCQHCTDWRRSTWRPFLCFEYGEIAGGSYIQRRVFVCRLQLPMLLTFWRD